MERSDWSSSLMLIVLGIFTIININFLIGITIIILSAGLFIYNLNKEQ